MKISIKIKLLFSIVIIILVFGALAAISVFNYSKSIIVEYEKENLQEITIQKANQINALLDFSTLLVEKIAEQEAIVDYMLEPDPDPEQVENINKTLESYDVGDGFSAIYLINEEGTTLVSTDEAFIGENYGFRDYFKKAIKGESYTDVSLGVTSKKLGYYFSTPIINDDQDVIGVAVIKMRPSVIDDAIETGIEISEIMLVDKFGIVVSSVKAERIYKSLGVLDEETLQEIEELKRYQNTEIIALDYEIVQNSLTFADTPKLFEIYDELDEAEEILSLSKIENFPFYLLLEEHETKYIDSAKKIAYILSIFVALAALSAIGVIILMVLRLIRPINKLKEAAEEISKGHLDQKIKATSSDELGQLAQAFNTMSVQLSESKKDVDFKVDEQTKDLQKFKLAVENASDHIIITDPDGVVLFANKAVEKITGYKKEEILGKKAGTKENWGGNMDKKSYEELWKVLKIDKKVFKGEIPNTRKGGVKYTADAVITPILNEKGEVSFFLAIERDITKVKKIDTMRTEFISLASHQLRTPLSGMKWLSEMLLAGDTGKLNEKQKEFVEDIWSSNERMINLVNTLLKVSKVETEKIVVAPKPVELLDVIKEILAELNQKIYDKKIEVKLDVGKDLPKVNVDPKLIKEVYTNLLNNAIMYSKEGGKLKIIIMEKDGSIVSAISDTGYGIPKDEQNKIFSKFYRGRNIVKVNTEGSGLGLYLAKEIVKVLGGKIWFESEEDKGTTFWFNLPIKR